MQIGYDGHQLLVQLLEENEYIIPTRKCYFVLELRSDIITSVFLLDAAHLGHSLDPWLALLLH
jgi:hypothetical protein